MDEQQREQLRAEYKLRPLTKQEEGFGVNALPNGVYGFSYAPATETPLFARKSYHSFEVHKTAAGAAHIVAFVTAVDAERLRGHGEDLDITVYPDPFGDATTMVTVSFDRVLNSMYKPIRYDGNALPLRVAAV